jgi:S1-C subfamily serine protease
MKPPPSTLLLAALLVGAILVGGCEAPLDTTAYSAGPVSAAPPPPRFQRAEGAAALERLGIAVRGGPQGPIVIAIDLDGPAARGGARIGDVVVSVNGTAVASPADLDRLAGGASSGPVVLDVMRGAERRQVAIAGGPPSAEAGPWNSLGLQVREVPGETLKALGLDYGIMVTRVRAPADRTRILPGDVIVGVNHTSIRSMEDFNRLVAAGESAVALLVRRADSDLYIAFEAPDGQRGNASRGGGLPPAEPFRTRRDATDKPLRT